MDDQESDDAAHGAAAERSPRSGMVSERRETLYSTSNSTMAHPRPCHTWYPTGDYSPTLAAGAMALASLNQSGPSVLAPIGPAPPSGP